MKTQQHPSAQSFQTLVRNTLGPGLQFSGPSNGVLDSMLANRKGGRLNG